MKVILLENIESLGHKNEIKEVADGYARNFLIPKKKVVVITSDNLEWAIEKQKETQILIEKDLQEIQKMAEKLDGLEVVFETKTGEQKQLYESIDSQKISQKLEKEKFIVKPSQIHLKEKIKELGEYPIKVSLNHNLEVEIRIIVESEKIKQKLKNEKKKKNS